MPDAPPIRFSGVSRRFGAREVLSGVTMDVAPGTITALIGRSGSGKSTLLRTINGMVAPTSGRVELFGAPLDYSRLRQARLRIGYAVQGTGLFPHLSIFENIALLARISGRAHADFTPRIEHLMQLVRLDPGHAAKYPHQLSGGEQQRVGLCRAIMLDPPIVLLDEAFGALDPTTRSEIHEVFLGLQAAEPRTIVLVTHDLREAARLASTVVVLDSGRIEQIGTPADILERPATDAVRRLIESQY
jgi:osmoprotectant transport system ATP-binding protein